MKTKTQLAGINLTLALAALFTIIVTTLGNEYNVRRKYRRLVEAKCIDHAALATFSESRSLDLMPDDIAYVPRWLSHRMAHVILLTPCILALFAVNLIALVACNKKNRAEHGAAPLPRAPQTGLSEGAR